MSNARPRRAPSRPQGAGRGPRPRDLRRRTLSQNFLRDERAVGAFLAALPPAAGSPGVEVGAGDGALTGALADHFGRLTAWELDSAMAGRLLARLRDRPDVRVEVGDFLASRPPSGPFHLAGNVPFGITTKVVTWCIDAPTLRSATMITQLEFARKRSGDYGRWSRLTVATWPDLEWQLAGRIGRASFRPVPAVDAGILRLLRRPEPLLPAAARPAWLRMVECGFEGRGGSLYASLRQLYPARQLSARFSALSIDRDEIVAFVDPDAWVALFRSLEGA
jgi:23S rRNA (adenine-N6)-dimethyltransferase